jgi:hypothetical protein
LKLKKKTEEKQRFTTSHKSKGDVEPKFKLMKDEAVKTDKRKNSITHNER